MLPKCEYAMLIRAFRSGEREAHILGIDIEVEITRICDKIITKQKFNEEKSK
jgi:hypothetical protein